jgi:hypothetical protein
MIPSMEALERLLRGDVRDRAEAERLYDLVETDPVALAMLDLALGEDAAEESEIEPSADADTSTGEDRPEPALPFSPEQLRAWNHATARSLFAPLNVDGLDALIHGGGTDDSGPAEVVGEVLFAPGHVAPIRFRRGTAAVGGNVELELGGAVPPGYQLTALVNARVAFPERGAGEVRAMPAAARSAAAETEPADVLPFPRAVAEPGAEAGTGRREPAIRATFAPGRTDRVEVDAPLFSGRTEDVVIVEVRGHRPGSPPIAAEPVLVRAVGPTRVGHGSLTFRTALSIAPSVSARSPEDRDVWPNGPIHQPLGLDQIDDDLTTPLQPGVPGCWTFWPRAEEPRTTAPRRWFLQVIPPELAKETEDP